MKGLDLKSTKDLIRLKEEIDRILSNRIDESKRNNIINLVDELPIGTANCLFESVTDKLFSTKKGKALIGKYVRTVKENKDLCCELSLCNFVNRPSCVCDTTFYLAEAVKLCKGASNFNCQMAEKKAKEVVKECLREAQATIDEMQDVIQKYNSINESVDFIVKNQKSFGTLTDFTNNYGVVANYVNEHKPTKVVNENSNKSVKELVAELNEAFNNGLTEWENRVIKDLSFADMSKTDKKELFEAYKQGCLDVLNERIEESAVEDKSQMFSMKTQLESKQYNADTVVDDLFKFSELKDVISEMK